MRSSEYLVFDPRFNVIDVNSKFDKLTKWHILRKYCTRRDTRIQDFPNGYEIVSYISRRACAPLGLDFTCNLDSDEPNYSEASIGNLRGSVDNLCAKGQKVEASSP